MKIEDMNIFKPNYDDPKSLPNYKGLYIITASSIDCLPKLIRSAKYHLYKGRPIIYIGISNRGIRTRDYKNHFIGTARNSTFRKSIGVLMGLNRKYEVKNSSKYKFEHNDETYLTKWMHDNLWLHYINYEEPETLEKELINTLSPPLNIKDNHSEVNLLFRKKLKELRVKKEFN